MSSTKDLKNDHIIIKRVRNIAQKCSENLYSNKEVSLEHLETISVTMEEFVDNLHHSKEEQTYFPETKKKDDFAEDIHKFLIVYELGRRVGYMFRRILKVLKEKCNKDNNKVLLPDEKNKLKEPVARFLKFYAVYIDDHTRKEDQFFELIESDKYLTINEDKKLLKHYEACKTN